jgi:tricorn protease
MHDGRIVYQHGADLRLLDVRAGADRELDVRLSSDFDQLRENWVEKPLDFITTASIAHDGSRVVITARGRVFVAPAKQGRLVQAARDSGVRYRAARFAPDGSNLVALSDRSGEVEWWTLPANGVGEPVRLTTDGVVLRWEGVVSPDGKLLAHHDKNQTLFITDIQSKQTRRVAASTIDAFRDLAWSPDSKWLAFVEPAGNFYAQVKLVSADSGAVTTVTSDRYDSFSPRFSPDGKWLYLLSNRLIRSVVESPWGPMAPEPFFDQSTKVYHIALTPGLRSPWRPDDELKPKDENKKDEPKKDDEKNVGAGTADAASAETKPSDPPPAETNPTTETKAADAAKPKTDDKPKPPEVRVEPEGIMARLEEVPLPAGNYSGLFVNDKALFFGSTPAGFDAKTNLVAAVITNDKPEIKQVAPDVRGYELSGDGKKLLIRNTSGLFVVDAAAAPAGLDKNRVDLSGWTLSVIPAEEFAQMYTEAWRLLRDYFYATNMHGVDWPAKREKYRPLAERVRGRAELNDVLAQLTGELAALHHFVAGGDLREGPDRVGIAWLGGELVRDERAGGYRVERVFAFDPDEPDTVPPLARPGVDVGPGDVITHINGVALLTLPDPAVPLRNQAGRQVLIRVVPAGAGPEQARDAVVVPVSSAAHADLRYREWQHTRRLRVEELGRGRIGYVHLRAMGAPDIAQFARHYYPVFNREGLIIDVRRNGGGNIDSWVLSRLMRRAWMFWNQRIGQAPAWNMQYAFRGHMVVICDAWTASDGEAFAEGFKRLGLGKVLGQRTWGGEIWLSFSNELVDKGIASAGEFGVFGPEGAWLIEGHGVDPDIVVDNLPHATFHGADAQLDAAVAHLQKLIAEQPVPPVQAPPLPDKSRRAP